MTQKKTTKVCPVCGSSDLILLMTMSMKVCVNHRKFVKINWYLDDGQKPLLGGK